MWPPWPAFADHRGHTYRRNIAPSWRTPETSITLASLLTVRPPWTKPEIFCRGLSHRVYGTSLRDPATMSHQIANSTSYKTHQPTKVQSARPPLRLPRTKTACMSLIQQLARDHHYWTRGTVRADRVVALVTKFDTKFSILDPARTRTRARAEGRPSARLVLYRQPDTDRWLFWLLTAGRPADVRKLSESNREALYSIHDRATPLTWSDEYELRRGSRGSMTWWLQRKAANDVEAELRYLSSAHGNPRERVDDLCRAVIRARNRPMFAGVRRQVGHAIYKAQRRWANTHPNQGWPAADGPLAIMRRVRIYDDPPAVIVSA